MTGCARDPRTARQDPSPALVSPVKEGHHPHAPRLHEHILRISSARSAAYTRCRGPRARDHPRGRARVATGHGAPKCLTDVGGRPLIEHQLDALAGVGVESVDVVVGFEQDQVREVVGDRARYVVNDRFAETNSLFSFLCAAEQATSDSFVLNADVLFDERVLWRLLDAGPDAIAYDSTSGGEPEEMKVAHSAGELVEMRKDLAEHRSRGENLGVLRLSRRAVARALAVSRELVWRRGALDDWLASAVNRVADDHAIACVDVAGIPWTEIDFPEDLDLARREVWPAIRGADRARAMEAAAAA